MAVIASSLIGKVAIEGADKAKGDLKSVGEHAKETESSFKKLKEQVARGFEFGTGMQLAQIPGNIFDAIKEQFTDVIKLAMDHQQVLAQTDAVLKSTASAFHGAESAVAGHYKVVALSTKQHEALQKQLDAANYSLLIATDHWDATKTHTKAAADAFAHAKERVAELQAELGKTSKVLVGGKSAVAATFQATKEEVLGLADSLSQVTPYSNDAILGMENIELTFTNIGRDTLPMATKEILNVSTAMHEDLKSAAVEVGKALGDPEHGMTALQRIGVTFNETQKETVKHLLSVGNMAGAQKIILQELHREFGGSAEAAGKTFAGALQIAQNKVEDLKIKIGTALLPILNQFLQYFEVHILPRLNDFSNWFQTQGIPKIQQFGDWFQKDGIPLLNQFGQDVGTVVGDLVSFVQWMQQSSPPAQALKFVLEGIGLAIAGVKIAGFVQDIASMATKATDFVLNAGKNLIAYFTGSGGLEGAADTAGKSVEAAGTETETMGNKAAIAGPKVQTLGTETAAAGGEIATAGTEAATAGGEMEAMGNEAAVAGGKLSGLLGLAEKFGGLSLLGMQFGETTIGQVSASTRDMNILQNEWNELYGASAKMPAFDKMNADQAGKLYKLWQRDMPGKAFPGFHNQGLAAGGFNVPGGWYTVGEQGPERMYVPQGASVFDHQTSMAMSSGANGSQPIILVMDGAVVARGLMPAVVNNIRNAVGVRF